MVHHRCSQLPRKHGCINDVQLGICGAAAGDAALRKKREEALEFGQELGGGDVEGKGLGCKTVDEGHWDCGLGVLTDGGHEVEPVLGDGEGFV